MPRNGFRAFEGSSSLLSCLFMQHYSETTLQTPKLPQMPLLQNIKQNIEWNDKYNTIEYCLFGVKKHIFFYFHFYAWFGMILKGMCERFLLSKDEPLTPDIDLVMALWSFRNRAQNTKIGRELANIGPLDPSFYFISPPSPRPFVLNFSGKVLKANGPPEKIWTSCLKPEK